MSNGKLTLRERIGDIVFPGQRQRMIDMADMFLDAYRQGPAILSPASLERSLSELDPHLIDMLVRQRGYSVVYGQGGYFGESTFTESDRLRAVEESRYMTAYNVQTIRAVQSWTDFGMGQSVNISISDNTAQAIWDGFWTAQRNSPLLKVRKLQNLSKTVLIDGEIFFVVYISTIDGQCTLRRFRTDEITDIVYSDNDTDVPLYYVRPEQDVGNVYYPAWDASDDMLSAATLPQDAILANTRSARVIFGDGSDDVATRAVIVHAAFSESGGRGWPPFIQSFPWSRSYSQNLEDYATIAKTVATFVDEAIHKGGSRVQDQIIAKFASTLSANNALDRNPNPAAGSLLVHNDQVEYNRRPLNTGAGDAREGSMILLGQVSAGDTVPMHWRGRPDAMQNRATAREQERPWLEAMQRYQTFWGDVFSDIVHIVIGAAGLYGGTSVSDNYSVDVQLQSPYTILADDAASLIQAVSKSANDGVIDNGVARRFNDAVINMVLSSYGVQDPDAITQAEQTEQPEPAEEAGPLRPFADLIAEFSPGQSLDEIKLEYRTTLYDALIDYFASDRPITAYRNRYRRAANEAFTFAFYAGWADGGGSGTLPSDALRWITAAIASEIGFVDNLFASARELRKSPDFTSEAGESFAALHSENYSRTLNGIYNQGKLYANRTMMLTFVGTDGVNSCATCQALKGRRMPAQWWINNDLIPGQSGNDNYECRGFRCEHYLADDFGNRFTV